MTAVIVLFEIYHGSYGDLAIFLREKSAMNMRAMLLEKQGGPLVLKEVPVPQPGEGQVLIRVMACGICRTDLHIIDGELPQPKLPLVPGHEIIGTVSGLGPCTHGLSVGDLVGVPWLGHTCGRCKFCMEGRENLCDNPLFTGYTIDGGYAEFTVAYADFCFLLSEGYNRPQAAPLLCAGLIGFRSYRMIDPSAYNLGLYGFGAAAHILSQLAKAEQKQVFAFTRDGDVKTQAFARKLGVHWAGGSSDTPPEMLDAAILFAPVGELIPKALKDVDKGGCVICGGIHMSDIPSFPYALLWEERSVRSVANLTRDDGHDFFRRLESANIHIEAELFPLEKANEAVARLRNGEVKGAAVLVMSGLNGEI